MTTIRDLEARIRMLERKIAARPLTQPASINGDIWYPVKVISGNTLATVNTIDYLGIKYANPGTTTTTDPDPGTVNANTGNSISSPSPATIEDGLGYGTLYNGSTYSRVILENFSGGTGLAALGKTSSGSFNYSNTELQQVWVRAGDTVTITGSTADFEAYIIRVM